MTQNPGVIMRKMDKHNPNKIKIYALKKKEKEVKNTYIT